MNSMTPNAESGHPGYSAWSSDPTHADKASAGCWSLLPNEWATGRGYTQVRFATGDDAVDFYRSCGWADEESLTLASTGMTTIILTRCRKRLANSHAGNLTDQVRGRSFVNLGLPGTTCGWWPAFTRRPSA
jgi:hypothetical protein